MTDNVIYGRFKPRLIHPTRTPLEDLAYAMARANEQDMQASVDRVFCKTGSSDPCEGTSKPGDS